jgi:cystathionine beta-synthase
VVVGGDPEGSLYTGRAHPYLTEGIGEDFIPGTFDADVVDRWVTVSDADAFQMARRVVRQEGLLVGGSGGTALVAALEVAGELGADDLVVVLVPDSGRGYVSKIFNDDWMAAHGLLEPGRTPPREASRER